MSNLREERGTVRSVRHKRDMGSGGKRNFLVKIVQNRDREENRQTV